jgi:uncharacterized protein YjdB
MQRFGVKAAALCCGVFIAVSACEAGPDKNALAPALTLFYKSAGEVVECGNRVIEIVQGETGTLRAVLTAGTARPSTFGWGSSANYKDFVNFDSIEEESMARSLSGKKVTDKEAVRISAAIEGGNGAIARVFVDVQVFAVRPLKSAAILSGGSLVSGGTIVLDRGQTAQLSVSTLPANAPVTTLTWGSGTPAVATVDENGKVTGVAQGSAVITVTASNEASSVSASVTVQVSGTEYVPDPCIWEWDYARDGGITDGKLAGKDGEGNPRLVSAAKPLNAARITNGTGGIQIDGSVDTTSCVLAVGTSSTSSSSASQSPDGEFDFRTGNTDGILVTVKMDILTEATVNREVGIFLNNSTSTSANTPLTTLSNHEARIYFQHPATHLTPAETGYWDGTTGTITCQVFKPADLNQDNIAYLEKAYLGFVVWSNHATNGTGAKVLIKSIRIEYVDSSYVAPAPLAITSAAITKDGTTIDALTLAVDESDQLSVALQPEGSQAFLEWSSGTPTVARVDSTGRVTAVSAGSATITVTASNNAPSSQNASITVQVSEAAPDPDPDSNLIWDWSYARDGGITSGTLNTDANDARIGGTGLYVDVPVKISNITSGGKVQTDSSGIIVDGTSGQAVLLVGSNGKAVSTATSCPGGIFNFNTNNTNGIKVTVDADILTDGGSGKSFALYLNNSTVTNANTPLRNDDNKARIIYYQNPTAAGTLNSPTANGVWTLVSGTHGTLTSRVFVPADFNQTYIDTLSKAFLGFAVLLGGPKIRINGIRIEYVDAVDP